MVHLTEKTLAKLCLEASKKYGDKNAFSLFQEEKICSESKISYKMLNLRAGQIALVLKQLGINPGDHVMLLSDNCPQWPLSYFGIATAGAVSVPVLTGFSAEQVQYVAEHAQVSAIMLNRAMMVKFEEKPISVPQIFIDSITEKEITVCIEGKEKTIPLPQPDGEFPQRKPEDLATIIYTSGTQGSNKGVMLSHSNLISCSLASLTVSKINTSDRILSVLPLAHSYECTVAMISSVVGGGSIIYLDRPPSPSILQPALKAVRPTIMAAVPMLIEKMYRNAIAPKLQSNKLYHFPLTRPLVIRIAGRKLIKALGGKLKFFGIGGAPLVPEVEQFLRRARFPYAIGYGLTEAAPLVAGTEPLKFPFRSTGNPIPGVELRIADSKESEGPGGKYTSIGEIQIRGPNVMMGYYRNEELTSQAFTEDKWLRTGDLGYLDNKDRLYVNGRIKSLILGPGGENIYPEEIEGLLNSSSIIEEALVYASEMGELIALVRLTDAAKAATDMMEQALEELRTWANKKLASFSRLSKIVIQEEPFEKTSTMKIKRYLYVPCRA